MDVQKYVKMSFNKSNKSVTTRKNVKSLHVINSHVPNNQTHSQTFLLNDEKPDGAFISDSSSSTDIFI